MTLATLVIPAVVATLLTQIGKQLLGKVSAKWGALASQITLLIVAFGVAGVGAFFQFLPDAWVQSTLTVFASAMVLYEIFYKSLYKKVIK